MLVPIAIHIYMCQKKECFENNNKNALTAPVPAITACYRAKQKLCPGMCTLCTHYHESEENKKFRRIFAMLTYFEMILWCSKIHPITIYQSHFCHNFPHTCHQFESLWRQLNSWFEEPTVKGTKQFMKWWRECCESSCLSKLAIDYWSITPWK